MRKGELRGREGKGLRVEGSFFSVAYTCFIPPNATGQSLWITGDNGLACRNGNQMSDAHVCKYGVCDTLPVAQYSLHVLYNAVYRLLAHGRFLQNFTLVRNPR